MPEPDGWKSLTICLEDLKAVTRRYSKKQLKWIKNRFLGSEMREVPLVYPLDTTDVSRWTEFVSRPAEDTVEEFITDKPIQLQPLEKLKRLGEGMDEETSHFCETCNRVFIGEYQWQHHIKSNKHRRVHVSKNKQERKRKFEEMSSEKTSS